MVNKNRFFDYILVICFLQLFGTVVSAQQPVNYSVAPEEFLKQFETFFTSSKTEVMNDAFKVLEKDIKNKYYSDEEFALIVGFCNKMSEQKLSANPYFLDYISAIKQIKTDEKSASRFKSWHELTARVLADVDNRKFKNFDQFLIFSNSFFGKKFLRYDKIGFSWAANSTEYELKYDNKTPYVSYNLTNLFCTRKNDTISINNTSGDYFPFDNTWKGKGGEVTWQRVGLADVKAQLSDYQIDMIKGLYEAVGVELTYPTLFPDRKISGSFKDQVVVENAVAEGSYPRFESRDSVLDVNNLGGGASYKGGFRLQGTSVYGYGSKENKAVLSIKDDRNGRLVFEGLAEVFIIRKEEKIVADNVFSTIYLPDDTITHPSLSIRYEIPKKIITFNRGQKATDRNRFNFSSFRTNVDVERLDYYIDKDSIIIGKRTLGLAKSDKNVLFESIKYYTDEDFKNVQNIASYNPINVLKNLVDQNRTNYIFANEFAKKINPKFEISNIQTLIYDLVAQGFITYDPERALIEVKDKITHFSQASSGKTDYDNLKIISDSDEDNGVYNLNKKEITVNGVKNIEYSGKQKVAFKPLGEQFILQKNRNQLVKGKLFAGWATFQGNNFDFDYDKFQINMDSVMYFDLYVPSGDVDKEGKPIPKSISSRIEGLKGVLLIDAPSNKSGKEEIAIFPSIQSKAPSYVYYDDKTIQNAVYTRDSFY
ncbi:MAG: hypothetical protein KBA06_06015, partial [Saprospiraceae bacterium]|nr:hypothetical protein [Saprospiraceae bacterium]